MQRFEQVSAETGMALSESLIESGTNSWRTVDWEKLYDFIKKNAGYLDSVWVGLGEDWMFTSDLVWSHSKGFASPLEVVIQTESLWATPIACIKYKAGGDEVEMDMWTWGRGDNTYFKSRGGRQKERDFK